MIIILCFTSLLCRKKNVLSFSDICENNEFYLQIKKKLLCLLALFFFLLFTTSICLPFSRQSHLRYCYSTYYFHFIWTKATIKKKMECNHKRQSGTKVKKWSTTKAAIEAVQLNKTYLCDTSYYVVCTLWRI